MAVNCPSKKFGLSLCLLLCSFGAVRAERLPLKTYTTADGLVHNVINKIVRDSRGFLWFCTNEGLSRFDGATFTNFGIGQGLPHAVVNDLLETREGEYWLATNGGLVRFDPRGIPVPNLTYAGEANSVKPMFAVVVPEDPDRRAKAISVLFTDHDGVLWCGTYKGLYRLNRTGAALGLLPVDIGVPHESAEQNVINDLAEDVTGSMWIATPAGLYRRRADGRTGRYTKQEGLPDEFIHDLLRDRQGRLWVGGRYGGLFRLITDGSDAPPKFDFKLDRDDGLPTGWIFQLFETAEGRHWAATARGLVEYFPEAKPGEPRFHVYNETNGLIYHDVTCLTEDIAGDLWMGTYLGAMKLARNGFLTYDALDGVLAVNAIFADQTGGVCFRARINGDGNKSVFEGAKLDVLHPEGEQVMRFGRFGGQSFQWFLPEVLKSTLDSGWVGEGITLQAQTGEWWIGTGAGAARFAPAEDFSRIGKALPSRVYTVKDGLAGPQIFRLFEAAVGDVWIATTAPSGLARWDHQTQTIQDLAHTVGMPSLKDDQATAFGQDAAGNVWVGFSAGVGRFHDGTFDFFAAGKELLPGRIQDVFRDRHDQLWLASARSGLIRVDNPASAQPSFVSYATAKGLASDDAQVITEDLRGNIYVGTGRGLDRFDPKTEGVKHYTTADGLASGEFLAAYCDRTGALWFGTQKGMSRLIPAPDDTVPPPPVFIAGLAIADVNQSVSALGETELKLPDLSPNQNQLRIDFLALGFEPGEVLRYQFKLEGADANWGAPTQQRTVNYARLAPGHYRFLVRAINSDGTTSTIPAVVNFTILPPIWQRWWFVLLAALAVSLLVYAIFRYRVAQILEVANIRTRIAADLHDDIGSNLTRIAILSEVAHRHIGGQDPPVGSPLASIANISRESVASMGDIVWAINPKRDSFRDLVQRMRRTATEMLGSRGIDFEFRTAEVDRDFKVGPNLRRDVFLLFKEALNNLVRHAQCEHASISFKLTGSVLVLTVWDDGRGFDLAVASEGQGLVSMRRRAENLGGALSIKSAGGQGTELVLRCPLRSR
jgi:ligand-binding sensor domain-containing protein/two-component sensor histidine kinase